MCAIGDGLGYAWAKEVKAYKVFLRESRSLVPQFTSGVKYVQGRSYVSQFLGKGRPVQPHRNNLVGFYAFRHVADACKAAEWDTHSEVHEVTLSGRIVLHATGYRAQRMKIGRYITATLVGKP